MIRRAALAALALGLAACFPEEPPADLRIACKATTDCPQRYVCSVAVGRCVLSDVEDKMPSLVGTPVLAPRIARKGVTLTLELAVSEELMSDPVVRLGDRRMVVDETGTQRAKQSYRFAYKVEGTEPTDAPVPVTVDLTDLAGQVSKGLVGGEARFDFAAPPAPDVAAQDKVVYHRVPWGAESTAASKRFWIEAGEGATEAGAEVLAFDAPASEVGAAELGRTTAQEDGSFQIELMRADRPVVWLEAVDAAGNTSSRVDVLDVAWTATLADKVPGREFENPHDYEIRPWFERQYLQPDAQELASLAPVAQPGGGAVQARGDLSTGAWLRRSRGEIFSRRHGHQVAFDARRRRVVLFGGEGWGDTYEWDGGAWTKRTPLDLEKDGNPPARSGHAMAYDAQRDRVVLFGGADHNGAPLADLWEWDGVGWTRRTATGDAPGARFQARMAYDSDRGRVQLFGGESKDAEGENVLLGDLWEWDGAKWTRPAGGSSGPPARSEFGLVYDRDRKKLVVFGGRIVDSTGTGFTIHKDTWEWDGAAWARVAALNPPAARSGAGMVYLPHVGTLLFGGWEGTKPLNDTALWDGTAWHAVKSTHVPPERRAVALAYDSARNRAVLCGGRDVNGGLADTWEWDGVDWQERVGPTAPADGPSPRIWTSLAYDADRRRTVLFGGLTGEAEIGVALGDTWEWDGARWEPRTPPATEPSPPKRARHALAFDRLRQRVVLFGGSGVDDAPLADTWEWDGTRWKDRTPPAAADSPEPRYGHAMVYQDHEGLIVLNGGTDQQGWVSFDDSWNWDGTTWRPARSAGVHPPGRSYHAVAYDRARSRMVLYGGQTFEPSTWICPPCGWPSAANDLYEWDGGLWQVMKPAGDNAPTALTSHAMTYGQRGRIILFGGGSWLFGLSPLQETWLWDGLGWAQASAGPLDDGSPVARSGHALAYDEARSRAVLFGGRDTDGKHQGDTWEWDDGAQARPGQVARFAFAAAQPEAATAIRSVTATFVAGGEGETLGAPASGVATWIWDRGSFLPASSGSFGPDAPGRVSWTTTDAAQTARLLRGPRQEIVVGVTPQGANGAHTARVAVDYVELVVRYRRPAPAPE